MTLCRLTRHPPPRIRDPAASTTDEAQPRCRQLAQLDAERAQLATTVRSTLDTERAELVTTLEAQHTHLGSILRTTRLIVILGLVIVFAETLALALVILHHG